MNEPLKAFSAFLFVFLAMVLSQHVGAAMTMTPAVQGYSGGSFSSAAGSFSMTAANDGFIKPTTISVGGRPISVPATLRMAANAGQYAKNAMKLNPWLIAGTLAAAWLLDQDMTWNGTAMRTHTHNYWTNISGCTGNKASLELVEACLVAKWPTETHTVTQLSPTFWRLDFTAHTAFVSLTLGTERDATDADWDALPDPLADIAPELPYAPYMPEGVPVDAPEYDFTPYSVPMGQPYEKPDGSTAQPMAKVSPNGDSVTVDTYDQPLTDSNGDPVPNPQPQDTPEPDRDVCQDHPDSLMCTNLGTPADAEEVPTTELPVDATVTPIGGAGTCPASVEVSGITWSYQPFCDFASAIRPLIIGFAWLSFAYIVAGVIRS